MTGPNPNLPSPRIPTRLPLEPGGSAQSENMARVETCLLQLADRLGRRLGLGRREFLASSCGAAAGFLALNAVFGPLFEVRHAEAADPQASAERSSRLRRQLIVDVQTHFVSPEYPSKGILGLRKLAQRWNPDLEGEQTLEDIHFENFFREIFLESETDLAVLSNAPNDDPERWFLSNEEAFAARERLRERAGSRRLLVHAVFTPGRPGWLEAMEAAIARRPDAWKGYTVGQPIGESRWPWRLDDEKLAYPAYEKMVKAGITTVCIHKGLLPDDYRERMASNWEFAKVDDVAQAARDWPQLDFVIYHSGIRTGGIPSAQEQERFEQTGAIPWVTDLARITREHGLRNVFAELGSVFAVTAVSAPRYCAGMLGTLVRDMGTDRVLWGTDSVWYGSPQWQIEALRRLQMPDDLRERFGYPSLGPADGELKNRIFAGNARQVYSFSTEGLDSDRVTEERSKT